MSTGYITVFNESFKELAKVLEKGITSFSQHSIEMVELVDKNLDEIYMGKLDALVNSPFDAAVILDADIVPNRCLDDLMEIALRDDFDYPLLPRHLTGYSVPGVEANDQTMHYGQSCVVVAGVRAKANLKSGLEEIREHYRTADWKFAGEEPHLNAWLWRCGAKKQLNYCCPPAGRYLRWRRGARYLPVGDDRLITHQLFHSEKHPDHANEMLDDILSLPPRDEPKPVIIAY